MNQYFKQRHTVRSFDNTKPVSIALIHSIIRDAMQAPTTGNIQLYSIIISTDEEQKAKLREAHFNQPASNAPILITFCADINRFEKWCENRDTVPGFRNLQSLLSSILDVTIVAQQFNTIAEINDLGCCYLGTTTYNPEIISEALNLPQMVIPIITLSVGYPDETEASKGATERLPLEAVIHDETYKDYDKERINMLYQEKENLEENKAFVKENAKDNLAQVFNEVRYPQTNNEIFSKKFYDFIVSKGIVLP